MRSLQEQIIQDLHVQPNIQAESEIRNRVRFLKQYLLFTGAKGFVLGISGGQDSTLAGRLAQMAVEELREEEKDKDFQFIAVRLPYGIQRDEADARLALRFIQPDRVMTINIKEAVDASVKALRQATGEPFSDFLKGNTKARERMKVQYDLAAFHQLLVLGTDHAAEAVTGFYTKFGDGASDLTPLYGLSKRQGKKLLQSLGAEAILYEKVPTADLLDEKPGRSDEEELQLSYEEIDDYLEGKPVTEEVARKIEEKYLRSRHKRVLPVTPFTSWWKN